MNIYTVRMGITRCYIIQDKGTIMVDSGPPNKLGNFIKSIQKASIDPKQIKLIVHTHGHWDHIGSAKVIKETTGAQIAMHEPDKGWLENSLNQLPPGVTTWGHTLLKLTSRYMSSAKIAATNTEIILRDEDFPLAPFGIPGKVVYTPGHTMGSVSVLLETGDAFVEDVNNYLNPGIGKAVSIKYAKGNLIAKGDQDGFEILKGPAVLGKSGGSRGIVLGG